jgi:hypothetical protein
VNKRYKVRQLIIQTSIGKVVTFFKIKPKSSITNALRGQGDENGGFSPFLSVLWISQLIKKSHHL